MNRILWWCEYLFIHMEAFWFAVDAHLAKQRGDILLAATYQAHSFERQRTADLMKWKGLS